MRDSLCRHRWGLDLCVFPTPSNEAWARSLWVGSTESGREKGDGCRDCPRCSSSGRKAELSALLCSALLCSPHMPESGGCWRWQQSSAETQIARLRHRRTGLPRSTPPCQPASTALPTRPFLACFCFFSPCVKPRSRLHLRPDRYVLPKFLVLIDRYQDSRAPRDPSLRNSLLLEFPLCCIGPRSPCPPAPGSPAMPFYGPGCSLSTI
jgi:hypothetical protein